MLPGKTYKLGDFIDIARRRLWLLPLPLLTLFGALVYSSRLPDVYQADMTIAIVPQRVPNEFVRSTVTLRTEERLEAITVQIKSRTVLEPMVKEFGLYPQELSRTSMEDVASRMRDAISVEMERPSSSSRETAPSAFHVRFLYPDPNIVARVTQRLGSIFVEQNARDRGVLAQATDQFLAAQLDEARQKLEVQEKLVEAFREKHGNELPTQLQSNLQAIQSAQLQVQAIVEATARDRDRKMMLERLYQEAQNEPPPTPPPVVQLPVAPAGGNAAPTGTAKQQLAAARAALTVLQTRLTPEHPDIVRVKRQIAELEPKAAAEDAARSEGTSATTAAAEETPADAQRRERLAQMRAEIESLDRQTQFKEAEERRLRVLVTEYQRRIEAVPGTESAWTALTRDYETQQAAYRDLLTKSEASKVAVDLENQQIGENFRVLDPARVPVKPVSPKRIQITGAGIALGFALAIGIAALLEFSDASFRSEAEIVEVLGMPVLAALPFIETAAAKRRKIWRRVLVSAAAIAVTTGAAYAFWLLRLWKVVV